MKKIFNLSIALMMVLVLLSKSVFAYSGALDTFIQHLTSESHWVLGIPAMLASLIAFMVMQKGGFARNQAVFFIGAVIPILTAAVFFLAGLLSESCVIVIQASFVAFCLTFVPFVPTLVLYLVLGKKFELLRNVYAALYLVCCIAGGLLGAPMQVFIGAALFALFGAFAGKYWHQDSVYMDAQMAE